MTETQMLEARVQGIYDAANQYAAEAGGVEYGMNVLYGPPLLNPRLMIVSMQGGGGDRIVQKTWPKKLNYADEKLSTDHRTGRLYPFSVKMRKDFRNAGIFDVLARETVATNVIFPQHPRFNEWERDPTAEGWRRNSRKWLIELIHLMRPTVLLTYGKPPFEELTGQQKSQGNVALSAFAGVPVIGCGHLSRCSRVERAAAMDEIRKRIAYG